MAQRTREQLNTANAALFVNNSTGDITPALEKAFNEDVNDSAVNIKGDTFAADAEFAFQNGSKFREGAIPHGYGGGIARVCANEKADQWEDGFRYLISTSGSTNTVVYCENINNDDPGSNDDEDFSFAVGSRWKNLVSGNEYICTQANEGDAIWIPISTDSASGTYSPTLSDSDFSVDQIFYKIDGNYCSISGLLSYSGPGTGVLDLRISTPIPSVFGDVNQAWGQVTVRDGTSIYKAGFVESKVGGDVKILCPTSFSKVSFNLTFIIV